MINITMKVISSHLMRNLALLAIFLLAASAFGQGGDAENDTNATDLPRPRPNLLRELGLSSDQIRQIRILNAELKPTREAAQRQLRDSNRELDQAIYAEVADEALIADKLQRYQTAQAALAKINFENELAVRKILTPDQLIRFREMRRRFAEARQNMQRRRQENNRPRGDRGTQGPANDAKPTGTPARPNRQRP